MTSVPEDGADAALVNYLQRATASEEEQQAAARIEQLLRDKAGLQQKVDDFTFGTGSYFEAMRKAVERIADLERKRANVCVAALKYGATLKGMGE